MKKEQNYFELRKAKVNGHPELPWLWHSVSAVLLLGLVYHLSFLIRDLIQPFGDQLLPIGRTRLIGFSLFAVLLYGDVRLRKWVIIPAVFGLAYFVVYNIFSFWLILYMGLAYVYLRLKIKFFPPKSGYELPPVIPVRQP